MRLTVWFVVVFVGIVAVACGPGAPNGQSSAATLAQDRAAIDKTRAEYQAAWRASNAEQIASLYTDDALVLYPNQPAVSGQPAIIAYFTSFFAEFVQDGFTLTSAEVEIVGPWAFDRGTYQWKAQPKTGGDRIEDYGKYLVILRRQADGSWRVARDMDNSDRPLTQSGRRAG
jgi:uncharacterized protein (TIGR02246 family)